MSATVRHRGGCKFSRLQRLVGAIVTACQVSHEGDAAGPASLQRAFWLAGLSAWRPATDRPLRARLRKRDCRLERGHVSDNRLERKH